MDQGGFITDEFVFTNNHQGIEGLASKLTLDDKVVIESTGSVWTNLYSTLDDKHIPLVLAIPLKTKAIASARIKSDEIDARILAHLLRDFWAIWVFLLRKVGLFKGKIFLFSDCEKPKDTNIRVPTSAPPVL